MKCRHFAKNNAKFIYIKIWDSSCSPIKELGIYKDFVGA